MTRRTGERRRHTEATASIRSPKTGNVTVYRRFNKPAFGPLGDSLEDFK
jgi:hypothetical protein